MEIINEIPEMQKLVLFFIMVFLSVTIHSGLAQVRELIGIEYQSIWKPDDENRQVSRNEAQNCELIDYEH